MSSWPSLTKQNRLTAAVMYDDEPRRMAFAAKLWWTQNTTDGRKDWPQVTSCCAQPSLAQVQHASRWHQVREALSFAMHTGIPEHLIPEAQALAFLQNGHPSLPV